MSDRKDLPAGESREDAASRLKRRQASLPASVLDLGSGETVEGDPELASGSKFVPCRLQECGGIAIGTGTSRIREVLGSVPEVEAAEIPHMLGIEADCVVV